MWRRIASHALSGGAKFQRRDHHGARSAASPPHASNRAGDYGQALKAFHAASANIGVTRRAGQFSKAGLEMAACGNTMKQQHVTVNDLLPGFVAPEKDGVVRIADLQSYGYSYLRP